jgi:uncharacterized protein (TIGR03437 family)
MLLALSCSASAQFTPAPNPFPVGNSPKSVVVGNLNGSSTLGIAVANNQSDGTGTVTLLAGDGMGGFTPARTTVPAGRFPSSLAVGYFRNQNYPDLVVTNELDNTVTVLMSDQNGGFTVPGLTYPVGNSPIAVAVGYFDKGTYPDLAVANRDSGTVTLLLNSQNGGFTVPGTTFPVGNGPSSLAVGDFNGDGYPDLAVTNELDNTVTVLLNNQNGGFTLPGRTFPVGANPFFVVVADFNGDNNLDLAIANLSGNNVTVLLGNGTGGFTPAPASPAVQGIKPVSMVVGDFNGDYIPDLAIADFDSNNVTVLLGTGTGAFKTGPGSPYAAGTNPVSLAVGDFNSDGAADLVVVNSGSGDATVLLNTLTSTPVMVSAATYSTTAPVAPGSIVSIFGTDSAITAPVAPVTMASAACLENMSVSLTDFSGVKTSLPLFYAAPTQSYFGPTQINALIPESVATGAASFTISIFPPPTPPSAPCSGTQTGIPQKGSVTVAAVAPGLFSVNEKGKGLASAYVWDLVTGVSSPVSTSPIDVAEGGTILALYGTGIQNRAKLSDVTVTIGSQTLPALYAGSTPAPGVDQVNVALPSTLAGSGTVYVTVSVAGTTSNQVTLYIQ